MKDLMIERRQEQAVAEALGITTDELRQVEYDIDEVGSDDGVPYYTLVEFREGSSEAVMRKIKGLEGRSVRLPVGILNLRNR